MWRGRRNDLRSEVLGDLGSSFLLRLEKTRGLFGIVSSKNRRAGEFEPDDGAVEGLRVFRLGVLREAGGFEETGAEARVDGPWGI